MFISKTLSVLAVVATTLISSSSAQYYGNSTYPNTTIANITVINTPIVQLALQFARNYSTDAVYKHSIRSWLFGSIIINKNETLRNTTDLEIQAVGAILHDLGWDMTPGSPVVSADKRFEVDGAIAARAFVEEYGGDSWTHLRKQLLFDAIALHTTRTISYYKENEVFTTSMGISVEYDGLKPGVTNATFHHITTVFPNFDLKKATNDTFIWFCQTKPESTTVNQPLQGWGDRYVANYTANEHLRVDTIFKNL